MVSRLRDPSEHKSAAPDAIREARINLGRSRSSRQAIRCAPQGVRPRHAGRRCLPARPRIFFARKNSFGPVAKRCGAKCGMNIRLLAKKPREIAAGSGGEGNSTTNRPLSHSILHSGWSIAALLRLPRERWPNERQYSRRVAPLHRHYNTFTYHFAQRPL